MWFYKQKENNFKKLAKIILYILLFTIFCFFSRVKMASIQEFLFMELNSEREVKIQDKEKRKKELTYSVYLIYAIIPIIYMLGKILSYLFFMVKSCSSNLLLIHGQIVSKKNSIELEYISTFLDLSFIKNSRILLYMIDMIMKMLNLWNANLFFLPLI